MTETVVVDRRFRGPPESANGGYACALAARSIDGPAEVTLRSPPPLDTPLRVERTADGVRLLHGDTTVAEARPAAAPAAGDVPAPVSVEEARRASARYPWRERHPYPTCFVCGPRRAEHDGLRLFAGPIDDGSAYAAPWTPAASLADEHGVVRPAFAWAALDCPSGIVTDLLGRVDRILLGRLTADLRAPLTAAETYVVLAWPLARDGRKLHTGSAILTAAGDLCAAARATWIEVAER